MSIQEILGYGSGTILALLALVEISPIKFNPWSAIAKAIGKAINQDVITKVSSLEKEVEKLQSEMEEERAVSCRARILRFGDEVLHGERHSKDHFEQILMDIKKYDDYCKAHPNFPNNVTEITSQRIKNVYSSRLEKNDFL